MMKGQLAGLMKQAQAMQDNLKKAQDELAKIEVEGQSGAGLVKVTMTCKHDVKRIAIDPSLLGRRQGHARGSGRRRVQRRGAPRRGGEPGEDGQADRRHAVAARHEVPVLSSRLRELADRRSTRWSRRCAACPASASSRRSAWPSTCCSTTAKARARIAAALQSAVAQHPPLRALPHLHRSRGVQHLPRRVARRAPACVVETPADQAALERTRQLPRPVFRADGATQPARRRRRRARSARPQLLERASDGGSRR